MQTASTFNPAAPVSCRYGAPLGRGNIGNDFDVMQPLHLKRLPLDSGGYDGGGAYWGHGVPVYVIHDRDGDFFYSLRARSREAAKAEFREEHPGAWFHGERNPVRVYDNGGATFDRFTAVYLDRPERGGLYAARGMSEDPFHPQGFGQATTAADGPHLGKRVPLAALPEAVQRAIYLDRTA